MTTSKQILNSHSPSEAPPSGRDRGPYSAHYAVNGDYSGWILLLIILLALGGVRWSLPERRGTDTDKGEAKDAIPRIHSPFTRRNE